MLNYNCQRNPYMLADHPLKTYFEEYDNNIVYQHHSLSEVHSLHSHLLSNQYNLVTIQIHSFYFAYKQMPNK